MKCSPQNVITLAPFARGLRIPIVAGMMKLFFAIAAQCLARSQEEII
jgi:hypothetical protein